MCVFMCMTARCKGVDTCVCVTAGWCGDSKQDSTANYMSNDVLILCVHYLPLSGPWVLWNSCSILHPACRRLWISFIHVLSFQWLNQLFASALWALHAHALAVQVCIYPLFHLLWIKSISYQSSTGNIRTCQGSLTQERHTAIHHTEYRCWLHQGQFHEKPCLETAWLLVQFVVELFLFSAPVSVN